MIFFYSPPALSHEASLKPFRTENWCVSCNFEKQTSTFHHLVFIFASMRPVGIQVLPSCGCFSYEPSLMAPQFSSHESPVVQWQGIWYYLPEGHGLDFC